MPFPFLPFGLIVSVAILGSALTLFGLAMLAMDRAMLGFRGTILPGMVRGVRAWIDEPELGAVMPPSRVPASTPAVDVRPGPPPSLEDLSEAPPIAVEHVRRDGR